MPGPNKMMVALTICGIGSGVYCLIAQQTGVDAHSVIQYGALGLLGVCIIYVITRLVPLAIESRRKETEAFLATLTSEREKLVSSMERLTANHTSELVEVRRETDRLMRELNRSAVEERRAWAGLMSEVKTYASRNTDVLVQVRDFLRQIKDNTNAK